MNLKKKLSILMISYSSCLGGGTKHMFSLGEKINNDIKVFYALPKSNNFSVYLNKKNFLEISDRKISFKEILNLKKVLKLIFL